MKGYQIFVEFTSGDNGIVDLNDIVHRYAAATEIRDQKKFREFYLDTWPTLAWKCGFDLSPETLYELLTGQEPKWVSSFEFKMATA